MSAWGAYGYRLPDLVGRATGLVEVSAVAREIRVDVRSIGDDEPDADTADRHIALIDSGALSVNWRARRALLRLHAIPSADELLHPWLAPVISEFASHDGAVVLHGGVLAGPRGALVLAGDREGGKSSLMAACALAGIDVLADDLAVIRGGVVSRGPRFLDLRPGTAERLPSNALVTRTRAASRWRLALPAGTGDSPLVGVVVLGWGEDGTAIQVVRVPVADRLRTVLPHVSFEDPARQAGAVLTLVTTPVWLLTRPRTWDTEAPVLDHLRSMVEAGGS